MSLDAITARAEAWHPRCRWCGASFDASLHRDCTIETGAQVCLHGSGSGIWHHEYTPAIETHPDDQAGLDRAALLAYIRDCGCKRCRKR